MTTRPSYGESDLVVRSSRQKIGKCMHQWNKPLASKPGCHTDRILFRYAQIEIPIGKSAGKTFRLHGRTESCIENYNKAVYFANGEEQIAIAMIHFQKRCSRYCTSASSSSDKAGG